MNQLLFSQSALYKLQQLVKAVRAKTGVRHRLSVQKDIFALLRYSCTSSDASIANYYALFVHELDEDQKNFLQNRGLLRLRIHGLNDTVKTVVRKAAM